MQFNVGRWYLIVAVPGLGLSVEARYGYVFMIVGRMLGWPLMVFSTRFKRHRVRGRYISLSVNGRNWGWET